MHGLIQWASGAIIQHPALALLLAFAGAVIEAVAVVGSVFPGTLLMMCVAGMAGVAGLSMIPVTLVAILGAVVGDGMSFWFGHRYGGHIRAAWPFRLHPEILERGEVFFRRFGVPSVALARFVPVVRATVPLVAGMSGMPIRHFLVADVVAASIWAPAHVLPAHLAGFAINRSQIGGWWVAGAIGIVLLASGAVVLAMHRIGRSATVRQPSPRP